jgi:hypothetical protein
MNMFIQVTEKTMAQRTATTARQFLAILFGLFFALTISPGKAHAQISGDIEADIPFQFHAGDAKFPAGKYVIHTLDNTDLTIMEISTEDGSTSALFEVHQSKAASAPNKTELIFNKYGNRYFLAKLFDQGNPDGSTVDKSRYEKRVGEAAAEAQAHVPAHHKGQQKS